jgi:hypothetical protein
MRIYFVNFCQTKFGPKKENLSFVCETVRRELGAKSSCEGRGYRGRFPLGVWVATHAKGEDG